MPCLPCTWENAPCFWRLEGPCVHCTKFSPKEKSADDAEQLEPYCEVVHCVPYDAAHPGTWRNLVGNHLVTFKTYRGIRA